MNLQKIEGVRKNDDGQTLDVIKVWPTIQGEGPFAGKPAVFVRLAGCNLKCPSCDTEYTEGRHTVPIDDLIHGNERYQGCIQECAWRGTRGTGIGPYVSCGDNKLVVLTGGEPFRQNITPFVAALIKSRYKVQIETNGAAWQNDWEDTFYVSEDDGEIILKCIGRSGVTIVCSPKVDLVQPMLRPYITCLKYVVSHGNTSAVDGLPITTLGNTQAVARPWPGFDGEIYIQPEDTGDDTANKRNIEEAVRVCMKFGYRLSLQTHKLLGVE